MLPPQLEYVAPATVGEAVAVLATKPDALFLGGNHQQVIDLKMRRIAAATLVDLRRIPELHGISADGDGLRIGAMTTLNTIMNDETVQSRCAALAQAAALSGDAQARNMDSIGGSLGYGAATSDVAAAVIALNAVVQIAGAQGERALSAAEFFAGNNLAHGEIITAITLPAAPATTASAYEKFKHPAHLGAVCGVAVNITRSADGTVADCALAVTGAAEHPARLVAAENALRGGALTRDTAAQAAALAAQGLVCVADLHFSAAYRAHLVGVLTRRALERLI